MWGLVRSQQFLPFSRFLLSGVRQFYSRIGQLASDLGSHVAKEFLHVALRGEAAPPLDA